MSKKKPVVVTIKKTRHKTQPYTFVVDDGRGPDLTVRERYTRSNGAKRGALRALNASAQPSYSMTTGKNVLFYFTADGRNITFVNSRGHELKK